jgi:DNA polymerase-4
MKKYAAVSRDIRRLMDETTPLVQPLSLDEAFLDLTGTERLHRQPPAVTVAKLAGRIAKEVGVTISAGLSFNKFLAKISSDLDKPRGFACVGREEALAFLAVRPVTAIFGVGKAFAATLAADGISTIGQIQEMDRDVLFKRYGQMGMHIWRLSHADDSRDVDPERDAKGISGETTFLDDITDAQELDRLLWAQCERVSARAKAAATGGATVTLKLKRADFRIVTRRTTLPGPTMLAETIYKTAHQMLGPLCDGTKYRLIGVGLSGLAPADACDKFDLFRAEEKKAADVEHAMDKVRAKFGKGVIVKGRAL